MRSSQTAVDLIINEETGGRAYYEKTEIYPTWPGGASGVTVGIGYDCGYGTADDIRIDWEGKITEAALNDLCECAGIHGSPARALAHEFHGKITIPWDIALAVFTERDIPKWENAVTGTLPNTELLSGDSFGALVSLAFNRGASFNLSGDRYREMRNIKALMGSKDFIHIPDQIRGMKRLWPDVVDLRNRRDHEAALFEEGIVISV